MPFRSESHNATPANPQTITAPAGIQNGDLLVAYVVADASTATDPPTFPSGFSEIAGSPLTCTADGQRLFVATKKANNESGNYTLGAASGDGLNTIGGIVVLSGVAAVGFVHRVSATNNNTLNASPWTITSGAYSGGNTTGICDLLWISASDENGVPPTSTSTPSGFTPRADFNDGAFLNLQVFTQDSVAPGDTGAYSSTVTDVAHTGGWDVFVLAILNAPPAVAWVPPTRRAPGRNGPFDQRGFLLTPWQRYSYVPSGTGALTLDPGSASVIRFLGSAPVLTPGGATIAEPAASFRFLASAPVLTPGGVTLSGTSGVLRFLATAPTFTNVANLNAPAASIRFLASAPSLSAGTVTIAEPSAVLKFLAQAPALSAGGTIAAPAAAVRFLARAPVLTPGGATLAAPASRITFQALAPTLTGGQSVIRPEDRRRRFMGWWLR